MASALKKGVAASNAMVDALVDRWNAGTIPGRTGSLPADCAAADTGTLLFTLTFTSPAFGDAAARTASANGITPDTSIDNTGTVGYCRVKTSGSVTDLQGSAGESADTPDFIFNEIDLVALGTVTCTSFTVTVAE